MKTTRVHVPRRSDGFSVVVAHAHKVAAVIATKMVDEVAFGDPARVTQMAMVEVEVDSLIQHAVHGARHRHRANKMRLPRHVVYTDIFCRAPTSRAIMQA